MTNMFVSCYLSYTNPSVSLGRLDRNFMRDDNKAWHVFIHSYFGVSLARWNKTSHHNTPWRYADGDEAAGFLLPSPPLPHHASTVSVLYLLFTRSSGAAHHVVKNINEISINSIFAPYGFAEAVALFKTICGSIWALWFLPLTSASPPLPPSLSLTAAACRPSLRIVSQNILRVPLGGRLHENYSSSPGASGTPDESERLVQPLLASSLCSMKRENKGAPRRKRRRRGEGSRGGGWVWLRATM